MARRRRAGSPFGQVVISWLCVDAVGVIAFTFTAPPFDQSNGQARLHNGQEGVSSSSLSIFDTASRYPIIALGSSSLEFGEVELKDIARRYEEEEADSKKGPAIKALQRPLVVSEKVLKEEKQKSNDVDDATASSSPQVLTQTKEVNGVAAARAKESSVGSNNIFAFSLFGLNNNANTGASKATDAKKSDAVSAAKVTTGPVIADTKGFGGEDSDTSASLLGRNVSVPADRDNVIEKQNAEVTLSTKPKEVANMVKAMLPFNLFGAKATNTASTAPAVVARDRATDDVVRTKNQSGGVTTGRPEVTAKFSLSASDTNEKVGAVETVGKIKKGLLASTIGGDKPTAAKRLEQKRAAERVKATAKGMGAEREKGTGSTIEKVLTLYDMGLISREEVDTYFQAMSEFEETRKIEAVARELSELAGNSPSELALDLPDINLHFMNDVDGGLVAFAAACGAAGAMATATAPVDIMPVGFVLGGYAGWLLGCREDALGQALRCLGGNVVGLVGEVIGGAIEPVLSASRNAIGAALSNVEEVAVKSPARTVEQFVTSTRQKLDDLPRYVTSQITETASGAVQGAKSAAAAAVDDVVIKPVTRQVNVVRQMPKTLVDDVIVKPATDAVTAARNLPKVIVEDVIVKPTQEAVDAARKLPKAIVDDVIIKPATEARDAVLEVPKAMKLRAEKFSEAVNDAVAVSGAGVTDAFNAIREAVNPTALGTIEKSAPSVQPSSSDVLLSSSTTTTPSSIPTLTSPLPTALGPDAATTSSGNDDVTVSAALPPSTPPLPPVGPTTQAKTAPSLSLPIKLPVNLSFPVKLLAGVQAATSQSAKQLAEQQALKDAMVSDRAAKVAAEKEAVEQAAKMIAEQQAAEVAAKELIAEQLAKQAAERVVREAAEAAAKQTAKEAAEIAAKEAAEAAARAAAEEEEKRRLEELQREEERRALAEMEEKLVVLRQSLQRYDSLKDKINFDLKRTTDTLKAEKTNSAAAGSREGSGGGGGGGSRGGIGGSFRYKGRPPSASTPATAAAGSETPPPPPSSESPSTSATGPFSMQAAQKVSGWQEPSVDERRKATAKELLERVSQLSLGVPEESTSGGSSAVVSKANGFDLSDLLKWGGGEGGSGAADIGNNGARSREQQVATELLEKVAKREEAGQTVSR